MNVFFKKWSPEKNKENTAKIKKYISAGGFQSTKIPRSVDSLSINQQLFFLFLCYHSNINSEYIRDPKFGDTNTKANPVVCILDRVSAMASRYHSHKSLDQDNFQSICKLLLIYLSLSTADSSYHDPTELPQLNSIFRLRVLHFSTRARLLQNKNNNSQVLF